MALYIIANPNAGNHKAADVVSRIEKEYPEFEVKAYYTECIDDEKNQVSLILEHFQEKNDQLLIIGGDGTLAKVAFYFPKNLPIAYYAVGSGNDFAHSLQMSDLDTILEAIKQKRVETIYVYRHETGLLINSLDTGFASWVIYQSSISKLKRLFNHLHIGKLIYLLFGILGIFFAPTTSVIITKNQKEKKQFDHLFFCSIANNQYFGGGISIWPEASVKKPQLDVVLFYNSGLMTKIKNLLALVFKKQKETTTIIHDSYQDIEITFPEKTRVQIDGEIVTKTKFHLKQEIRQLYR
ncbi:diacylglycerol/lipid kinase family protein [Streptococcus urinalis]|nr:diacylglycerol kinase family protein [Streptococcus urinalis]